MTRLVTTGRDVQEINDELMTALTEASLWMSDNKLSLNLSKTKCMYVGTAQRLNSIDIPVIKCNDQIVDSVPRFKCLGIIIDRNLKFDEHVKYLKGKIYAKMKTLGHVRSFISQSMALDMYKSLVIPHLDFGDAIYDVVSKTDAQTLQVLQNQCLRICLKADPQTSIEDLHRTADIPMLTERRTERTCNIVFRGVNRLSSNGVNNLYSTVSINHDIDTQNSANGLLKIPKSKLNVCRGNISHRGAVYYNSIPAKVRETNSTNSFKHRLKKHLKDKKCDSS